MKRFLIFAAAACLLSPDMALAQPGRPGNGPRPGQSGGNNGGPGKPVPPPKPVPGKPNPGGPNRPNPGKPVGPVPLPHPVPGKPGGPGLRPPPRPNPPAMRPPARPGHPQFSWRGRWFNPVQGPAFRYPRGYSYRRWTVGALLPSLFLAAPYYYDNWSGLGIGAPPPGRRWVRYGPDLLLVNVRTRQVEDVIPNVFY